MVKPVSCLANERMEPLDLEESREVGFVSSEKRRLIWNEKHLQVKKLLRSIFCVSVRKRTRNTDAGLSQNLGDVGTVAIKNNFIQSNKVLPFSFKFAQGN